MRTLIHREFDVGLAPRDAWKHLAQVERWPSWARHIRRAELTPPGELCARTSGRFRLSNGVRSEFRMLVYEPPQRWTWVGPFLWLQVEYEHRFQEVEGGTRLTWIVRADGFGVALLGRLFAKVYERNLDRAIPLLVAEMDRARAESRRGM